MKKFLSVLLAVLTLTACMTGFQVSAYSAVKIDGDWKYEVLDDGTASVFDYIGTEKEITIPSKLGGRSVTSVNDFFSSNSNVEVLNIPEWITKITEGCLAGFFRLKSINVSKNNTKYSSLDGVLYSKGKWALYAYPRLKEGKSFTIPSTVKTIGKSAFLQAENLREITIPDSVKEIRQEAFYSTWFYSVTIPGSVETIGEEAFSGCRLYTLTLSEGIKRIEKYAFYDCGIEKLSIPASVEYIAESAFARLDYLHEVKVSSDNPNYCSYGGNLYNKDRTVLMFYPTGKSATKVTVSSPVKRIGAGAFMFDENLQELVVGSSVEEIGNSAFEYCENLKSVTLPDTLKKIEDTAFYHVGITKIDIPKGLTELPECAFSGSMLESVNIPGNIKTIGEYAFISCENLQKIIISDGVENIGGAAFRGCGINTVEFPESVKNIGEDAFSYCSNLKSVTLPEGLTSISKYCFRNTGLESIIIPDSVTEIGDSAFRGCQNLKRIEIPPTVTSIGGLALGFNGMDYSHIEGFAICGIVGSEAYRYAKSCNMEFISTGDFLGDVNSDGEINIKDATAIQSYLAGLTNLTDFEKPAADIDGNGEINVIDATTLQKKLANII